MEERKIYITDYDIKRLNKLLEADYKIDIRDKKYLMELENELQQARVVASRKIPKKVITMNSQVRLKDLDSGKEMVYSLVFPGQADISQNKISILSPLGTALIGYRTGDIIKWKAPAGLRRLKVEEVVYQPEAAGDYHL